jgi:hypothetical protein
MKERGKPIGFQSSGQVALIGDRYKIYGKGSKKNQASKVPALKLFDLVNDPAEKNDLAAEHPEVVKQMTLALEAWRASCRHSDAGKDYQK